MTTTRLLLAASCAATLAATAPAEDLTLVFKSTSKQGASTETSYYSSEKMRTGGAENETIVEYGTGEMEAAFKQITAQMDAQMAQMPEAVREKMQQMMGGVSGAVSVTKGATRQVAGYSCQDYTVAMGESLTTKLCATTALAFPAPNVDYKKFASFGTSAGAMANNPMFKGMSKLTDELKKIEGLTIAEATSFKMMGQKMDTSREAVEIKKGPIPASAFDLATIAKGYKKVAHPVTKMAK
jgi:hypothetical protein